MMKEWSTKIVNCMKRGPAVLGVVVLERDHTSHTVKMLRKPLANQMKFFKVKQCLSYFDLEYFKVIKVVIIYIL